MHLIYISVYTYKITRNIAVDYIFQGVARDATTCNYLWGLNKEVVKSSRPSENLGLNGEQVVDRTTVLKPKGCLRRRPLGYSPYVTKYKFNEISV